MTEKNSVKTVELKLKVSQADMLRKAVANFVYNLESLKKKLDTEGQAEAAKKLDDSIKELRDLETELLF